MTIEDLKDRNLIVFECLSGSHAYGLNTPESDVDIKGVFVLPEEHYFGLKYIEQVNDEKNDLVYYELKRFVDLLSKSNPNILEMLYSPEDCILHIHPEFQALRNTNLLSKQCKDSFGGYAMTQIRKAKGLNKKILNPVDKEGKGVLDFCFVSAGSGSIPLREFLKQKEIRQEDCGLAKIPHMNELYGIYHGDHTFKGLVRKDNANEVALSSIPKGLTPIGLMSFNKSGYSSYCKEYKEYWTWVEKRNDSRYNNTIEHGKNYDAKNMMHTFRLLKMCEEIGLGGKLNVRRPDRDYLLDIKSGKFDYEELLQKAEEMVNNIEEIYSKSTLPESINIKKLETMLVSIRKKIYAER